MDQSTFDERAPNRRVVTDTPNHHIDLTAAGRFRETVGSNVRSRTYTYQSPGTDVGILDFGHGNGDRCSFLLEFALPTAGNVNFQCRGSTQAFGSTTWRLTDIP